MATPEENGGLAAELRLDLNDTANALRVVRNAYVIPPAPTERPSRWASCGVLDADGVMVEQSISWSSTTERVNQAPEKPETARHLPGRYVFGGVLYGHFGHFILESLGRIWALDAVGDDVEGIIFTPKAITFPDKAVQQQQHLAELLGMRVPIIVAREPLVVDELVVPAQGVGLNDLIEGSEAFRRFMNTHAGAAIAPDGPEKLYISRSMLPRDRGSILGEYKFEEYLKAEGYEIFHPQRHKPEVQIARYKAARLIVGVDCSPMHMVAYVGNSGQNTAVIMRRSQHGGVVLPQQLRVFTGMKATGIDVLVDDWFPTPGHRPSRSSWGEVDYPALHAQLLASGHISDPTPWPALTEEERAAELARLETVHGTTFRSFNEYRATTAKAAEARAAALAARAAKAAQS